MRFIQLKIPPDWLQLDRFLRRKTVRAFAEAVDTLEELGPLAARRLLSEVGQDEPVLRILLAPAQNVLKAGELGRPAIFLPWEITPVHHLVLTDVRLVVLSSPYQPEGGTQDGTPVLHSIPLADILSLETGFVLLNAWMELVWAAEGRVQRLRVHHNTVSRELFEDLCMRMRVAIGGAMNSGRDGPAGCPEPLANLPYKFKMLIPHHLLLPDETVQAAVFRPAQWRRHGLVKRRCAPNLAIVRTDVSLLMAGETLSQGEGDHSWVGRCVPLGRVRAAHVEDTPFGAVIVLLLAAGGGESEERIPLGLADPYQVKQVIQPWIK